MTTQKQSPETSIKRMLNESEQESLKRRQNGIEEHYKQFLATCGKNVCLTSSAGVLYRLLGEDNHAAEDVIREMKESARFILGFLAQPEIAKRFEEFRGYNGNQFAKHLLQLLDCLEVAGNSYSMTEMGLYEMDMGLYSHKDLDNFEKDLEEFEKMAD